jgi:hypothetical protein
MEKLLPEYQHIVISSSTPLKWIKLIQMKFPKSFIAGSSYPNMIDMVIPSPKTEEQKEALRQLISSQHPSIWVKV